MQRSFETPAAHARTLLRRVAGIGFAAVLAACAGPAGESSAPISGGFAKLFGTGLSGSKWMVETALGKAVPAPVNGAANRLDFDDAERDRGTFSASIGCNEVFGKYRFDAKQLVMIIDRSTKMACAGELGMAERRLIAAIGATNRYRISSDLLELFAGAQPIAVLRRR